MITSDRVSEIFEATISNTGDIEVEGLTKCIFSREKIEPYQDEIFEMLKCLPDNFMQSKGGGWSFLNACQDNKGNQWTGSQRYMEQLFLLGMAIGKVNLLMPREMWKVLPGGVPYYSVIDK
jgi:hypothetical protein